MHFEVQRTIKKKKNDSSKATTVPRLWEGEVREAAEALTTCLLGLSALAHTSPAFTCYQRHRPVPENLLGSKPAPLARAPPSAAGHQCSPRAVAHQGRHVACGISDTSSPRAAVHLSSGHSGNWRDESLAIGRLLIPVSHSCPLLMASLDRLPSKQPTLVSSL